jgi:hypothetical protein
MKKSVLLFSAVFLLIATSAMADQMFDFSYSGPDISGSGWFDATANGAGSMALSDSTTVELAGSFTVLNGSTTVIVDGQSLGNFTLIPNPSLTSFATSPLGLFWYDSQYLAQSNPLLDIDGLLFSSGSTELNIWNNPGYTLYTAYTGANGGYPVQDNNNVSFTVTPDPVPEPSTILLFGAGIAGVAIFRKRMTA